MHRVLDGGGSLSRGGWGHVGARAGWVGISSALLSIPDAKSAYCGVEQLVPSVNLAFFLFLFLSFFVFLLFLGLLLQHMEVPRLGV